MRSRIGLCLLALVLLGCRGAPKAPAAATGSPAPQVAPTATLANSATPAPGAPPTPTSLADGVTIRLTTPDASPNCPDHYPWFFDNRADECAKTLLNTWGAFETFEHGVMVWIEEGGFTYVLIDDGSPFRPYQVVVDVQGLPLPDPDPNLQPPPGLFQPTLGFAKFWQGLVPGTDWVRQRLGWATAPEADYSVFWQCNTLGGDAARCYFTGPRDEIVVMARGSAQYWAYWQGPVR